MSSFSLVIDFSNHHDGSSLTLSIDTDTTLLQVMHDAQLPVRKACRNGGCGVCRCRLVAGEISYGQRQPFALWEKDKADGIILPCIALARSDIKVDQLTLSK